MTSYFSSLNQLGDQGGVNQLNVRIKTHCEFKKKKEKEKKAR